MFVEMSNAPVYVDIQGEGEPALFLHGVPDSGELWSDVVAQVKSDYRCYVPDLPGFYRSGIPEDFQFELHYYGEFVNQLIDRLDISTPLTLVVHDWGGIFALSFACQYPEKVKRIVGGSFPFSHLYRWHPWARIWQAPMLGELSMLALNQAVFSWEMRRGGCLLSDEHIRQIYKGKADQWRTRGTVLKLYRSAQPARFLAFQNRLEVLASTVDLDMVWGSEDKYIPVHMANLMHANTIRVVDGCGHWVPVEAPNEIVALLVKS